MYKKLILENKTAKGIEYWEGNELKKYKQIKKL